MEVNTDMMKVHNDNGFSLVELMIVVVIIGIMASQAIYAFTSPVRKIKSASFSLRNDINLARGEAVNRGMRVGIDFTAPANGYTLWVDADNGGDRDAGEEILKEVELDDVEYYGLGIPNPQGPGPAVSDGVTFTDDRFVMLPNGSSDKGGTVYLYVPHSADGGAVLKNAPFRIVLNNIVGRVHLYRWRPEEGANGEWKTK